MAHHVGWLRKVTAMVAAFVLAGGVVLPVLGQEAGNEVAARLHHASHIVIPQSRSFALDRNRAGQVQVESVRAQVRILEGTATTTLEVQLRNPSGTRAEAVLLLPVPEDAAVSAFMFEGAASEPTAQLLKQEEARRLYDDIVAQLRDPALLEFAGYNLVRSSVFPVEPGGTQRVRLTYESILECDGERIDYFLPRSESLLTHVPWHVEVEIEAKSPISMVYSPSHDIEELKREPNRIALRIAPSSITDPGAFRLSCLLERGGVSASLFAYPDPKVGGGYFLLLAGLPAKISDARQIMKREVTIVFDRSGSMAGEKFDQARAAAMQVIEGLADGEAFNIIDYSNVASVFSKSPVIKTRETTLAARAYIDGLRPTGGTNIHDALVEALRQPPTPEMLPIVLFLTDGLPTVGKTSEVTIRRLVEEGNLHHRRVFTFGVGADVNVPLLDRLAELSRATTTYVLAGEDVEVKVGQTFRRLYGPVLSDVSLVTRTGAGVESTTLVRELIPPTLPDVFEGDQVILLGQYRDDEPVTFELTGNFLGTPRTFTFTFDFDNATTRHAFVPRLWASRRIAYLVDEIRQAGALTSAAPNAAGTSILSQPRYRELTDEIVRLSTEFGILSEYTAFLATEGTNLGDWENLIASCTAELDTKAVRLRSGRGAVSQGMNNWSQKDQSRLNYDNRYWNAEMQVVEFSNVQQVSDRAFLKRGTHWIDTRLITGEQVTAEPDRIVQIGTPEHRKIVRALVAENRQGCISLPGDILISHHGEIILIRNGPDSESGTEW